MQLLKLIENSTGKENIATIIELIEELIPLPSFPCLRKYRILKGPSNVGENRTILRNTDPWGTPKMSVMLVGKFQSNPVDVTGALFET